MLSHRLIILIMNFSSFESFVDISCVYPFLSTNHNVAQRFLYLLCARFLNGFCTALLFKSSSLNLQWCNTPKLGTSLAFQLWFQMLRCIDIRFSKCFYQTTSMEAYQPDYSSVKPRNLKTFKPLLAGSIKPSILM